MLNLSDSPPLSRLYGRRKGRPLRTRKAKLVDEVLPKLKVELPSEGPFSLHGMALFSFKPAAIWLEIGFGGGEHLAAQAGRNPNTGFIGCEPFLNGIASLLDHIDRKQLNNVRIFPGDARELLDALPDSSIARCFLLFPDPWPKARHAKRRFIGPENMPRLARVLRSCAELRVATDDRQLADWIRDTLKASPDFTKTYDSPHPPKDWVPTRYEQKALKAQRNPAYLSYCRM